ncbi:50S ribosomal protein L16 [Rhodovibrio salinarum]|uniref:Large ribosomal subunit protein uL16 n=1 Tax=Rhodovibrio salinarum TaxID=1087 RepID=A0A934UZA9_9PROT|nr:50S ribosomal protein L16 [Rhodovibrio salinarum]MBK1696538.1 50S ribosomal protein L16 [Rhodovibrio salinarum]
MLQPNRTKYRKVQKGKSKLRGVAKGGTQLNFGRYGLKATSSARISARQIEAARRSITRHMRRVGKLWIRIFPDVPITDKPAEVRMGKGKGTVEWWCARVRPGRVIFELDGVPQEVAEEAFRLASAKLPVETKFVTRLEG